MGFLDKKTRVMDIALTERGRQLLAENRLQIKHYAFSDELIDYSGSLAETVRLSASMDDIIYRNHVALEATSMGGSDLPPDLRSFLYTCPDQRTVLPPFIMTVSGATTLTRIYELHDFNQFVQNVSAQKQFEYVLTSQQDEASFDDREKQFMAEQDLERINHEDPTLITFAIK